MITSIRLNLALELFPSSYKSHHLSILSR